MQLNEFLDTVESFQGAMDSFLLKRVVEWKRRLIRRYERVPQHLQAADGVLFLGGISIMDGPTAQEQTANNWAYCLLRWNMTA